MSNPLMSRLRTGLFASASFVRGNPDRVEKMHAALDAADEVEQRIKDIEAALCKLTFMARTAGGWEPDKELMNACDNAEALLHP